MKSQGAAWTSAAVAPSKPWEVEQDKNFAVDPEPTYWYRFEDRTVSAGVDEWERPLGPPRLEVALRKHRFIKATPKGAWISVHGSRRFVLESATKKFACPTIEAAKESFVARKSRQAAILMSRVNRANEAIRRVREKDWS